MKIVGYILQNIQSWDMDSGTVPLSQDRMNVIIAPSETGKSVVVKILKEMCFAGNWGYTWNSLIKRGAESGTAAFLMEDGSAVVYIIWRNKVRYVIMDKDPKVEPKIWDYTEPNHTEIPEEVANHLGLIVDRKGKTVINVLDKDMVTPFVTASPELNARIAAVITVVPEMEKRRESLQEWQNQLRESFKVVDNRLAAARTRYNSAPEVNLLLHQIKLDKAERLVKFIEPLDVLTGEIKPEHLPAEPVEVTCPNLDNWIECCSIIDTISTEYNELISLNEPEKVVFDEETVQSIVSVCNDIDTISVELKGVTTTLMPKPVESPKEVGELVKFMQSIIEYGEVLKELTYLQEPEGACEEPSQIVPEISAVQSLIHYVSNMYADMLRTPVPIEPTNYKDAKMLVALQKFIQQMPYVELCNTIDEAANAYTAARKEKQEIEKLREELKVCPTCDRPWN